MSDTMLYGVLRMPYEMAMEGEIARVQFYNRAQEAANRLEAAERRLAEIDAASPSPSPASDAELPPVLAWAVESNIGGTRAITKLTTIEEDADRYANASQAKYAGCERRKIELCARAASTRTASDQARASEPKDDAVFTEHQIRNRAAFARAGFDSFAAVMPDLAAAMHEKLNEAESAMLGKLASTASDTRTAAGEAECDAALRAAPASQHDAFPAILFDGKAVYDEITAALGASHCISHTAVSATLDAVVRLIRHEASTDAAAGPACQGGNTQSESFAVELGRESIAARTQADAGQAPTTTITKEKQP